MPSSELWYLPLKKDRESLSTYLGHNLKSLFKGQVSGFDAQFVGYYGNRDPYSGIILSGGNQRRDIGEKCYIAFRTTTDDTKKGEAIILTPNYTWETIITSPAYNYYPVKLFRTSYFKHKDIN